MWQVLLGYSDGIRLWINGFFLDEEARVIIVCWMKLLKASSHSETSIVGELSVPPISSILM